MDRTIVISDKDSMGWEEQYCEFFKCPNCKNQDLIKSFDYCPGCGCKLQWDLIEDFSLKEEVTLKTGKFAGVLGNVIDYNRKTGKVTIMLDKDCKITKDYEDIIRKND